MKSKFTSLLTIFLCFTFSCGKSNLNLYDVLPTHTWQITSFLDKDTIKKKEFIDWQFIFETNNTVKAKKNSETMYGKWLVNTSKDNSTNLVLSFDKTPPFHHLSMTWKVKAQTSSSLDIESADSFIRKSIKFESI